MRGRADLDASLTLDRVASPHEATYRADPVARRRRPFRAGIGSGCIPVDHDPAARHLAVAGQNRLSGPDRRLVEGRDQRIEPARLCDGVVVGDHHDIGDGRSPPPQK